MRLGVTEGVGVGMTLSVGVGVGEGDTQIGPAVRPIPTSGPVTPTCVVPMAQWPFTVTTKDALHKSSPHFPLNTGQWFLVRAVAFLVGAPLRLSECSTHQV